MNANLKTAATATDYKVADLELADFGRKEIAIAETLAGEAKGARAA